MNHATQFAKVTAICQHLKAERGTGAHAPNEVVSVTTAYLLACDRTDRVHAFEQSPKEVFANDRVRTAQFNAWKHVWSIIGQETTGARYDAAWDVWGVITDQSAFGIPGMLQP